MHWGSGFASRRSPDGAGGRSSVPETTGAHAVTPSLTVLPGGTPSLTMLPGGTPGVRCREGIYNQCRHLVDDRCHNLVDDLCRQGVYNYRPGSPEGKNSSRYPRCLSIHAGGASRIQAPTTFHNGNRRLVSAVRNGNGNLTASRPSTALNNR